MDRIDKICWDGWDGMGRVSWNGQMDGMIRLSDGWDELDFLNMWDFQVSNKIGLALKIDKNN